MFNHNDPWFLYVPLSYASHLNKQYSFLRGLYVKSAAIYTADCVKPFTIQRIYLRWSIVYIRLNFTYSSSSKLAYYLFDSQIRIESSMGKCDENRRADLFQVQKVGREKLPHL